MPRSGDREWSYRHRGLIGHGPRQNKDNRWNPPDSGPRRIKQMHLVNYGSQAATAAVDADFEPMSANNQALFLRNWIEGVNLAGPALFGDDSDIASSERDFRPRCGDSDPLPHSWTRTTDEPSWICSAVIPVGDRPRLNSQELLHV